MKPMISTEICSAAQFVGEARAIELIAAAGFDAWDFSMFDMARMDWSTGRVVELNHPLQGPDYGKFARQLRGWGRIAASTAISPMRPFLCISPLSGTC